MFRRALTRLASSLPSASLAAGAFASLRSAAWCTEAEDKQEFRQLINAAQLDHSAFADFERIGKATVIELLSSNNSKLCQEPPDVTAVRDLAAELLSNSAIAGTPLLVGGSPGGWRHGGSGMAHGQTGAPPRI